jgi:hypothetical protein
MRRKLRAPAWIWARRYRTEVVAIVLPENIRYLFNVITGITPGDEEGQTRRTPSRREFF